VRRGVSVPLPAGCPAPYAGRLYDRAQRDAVRGDIATLEALVVETEKQRDLVRVQLAECRTGAADALDACVEGPATAPAPRHVLAPWKWATAGSVAAAAPLVACGVVECGGGHVPVVAAGAAALLVAGLAWLSEP